MYLYRDQRRESDLSYMGFSPKNPQSSKVWIHFARTSGVVKELGANPADYIKSQFVFRKKAPYPNSLYSNYAKWCYEEYMGEKQVVSKSEKFKKGKSIAYNLSTLFKKMSPADAVESIAYMLDDGEYKEIIRLIEIYSPERVIEILDS